MFVAPAAAVGAPALAPLGDLGARLLLLLGRGGGGGEVRVPVPVLVRVAVVAALFLALALAVAVAEAEDGQENDVHRQAHHGHARHQLAVHGLRGPQEPVTDAPYSLPDQCPRQQPDKQC